MTKTKSVTIKRPPVVVVMGHIDHGKSTLLDYIRATNTPRVEAGGITQAVSAYEITVNKNKLTFIDTPGHAAFATMRERGASIADIAILVVSAEDGVKPQTLEAHKAIVEQKIPYVVAINKIDKPSASVEKVKPQLAENNILLEEYGGKVPYAAVSAKTGAGVPELLELLLLIADLEDWQADPSLPASGFVLETRFDARSGNAATLIIKNGTLQTGNFIVIDGVVSPIRKINNFLGEPVATLTCSAPAEVIGFTKLPTAGAAFHSFASKKEAENFAKETVAPKTAPKISNNLDQEHFIPIIIKASVQGGVEAVAREIGKLESETLKIKILQQGVGNITENDVKLASGSRQSIIVGFNVTTEKGASDIAEKLGITIATFDIIYKLTEWLAESVEARRPRQEVMEIMGKAKILKIFSQDKNRQVVGGGVVSGKLQSGKNVKISRRDAEISQGKIIELQQQKLKVKEVESGQQFGALIEAKIAIAPGDTVEAFDLVTK